MKNKKIIGASIAGLLTLSSVIGSASLSTQTIVYAASKDVQAVHNKIEHIRYSLKKNYLGLKNVGQWQAYIKEARKLNEKITKGASKNTYAERINKAESLVNAAARVNQVEKSMETNALIIRNVPQWNTYIKLSKDDLAKVDKEFVAQVNTLTKRIEESTKKINEIESKYNESYRKVENLYNEALKLGNTNKTEAILKLKEAETEANKLQTHSTKDEIKNKIQSTLIEYEKTTQKIEILGVKDKEIIDLKYYTVGITPSTKSSYDTVKLLRDGSAVSGYILGQTIKEVGVYSLEVSKGSDTTKIGFEIKDSRIVSNIEILGVKDRDTIDLSYYTGGVTPSTKSSYDTVRLMKNGVTVSGYTLGQTIKEVGDYYLVVSNGNDSVRISFEIKDSRISSNIEIQGVRNNDVIDLKSNPQGITPSTKSSYDSVSLLRNGNTVSGYILGQTLKDVGLYTLFVRKDNNNIRMDFEIKDSRVVSNIEILGIKDVMDLNDYPNGIIPSVKGDYDTVALNNNGYIQSGYTLGQAIKHYGKYTLIVAKGNDTVKVDFEVKDTREESRLKVSGPRDGEVIDLFYFPKGPNLQVSGIYNEISLKKDGVELIGTNGFHLSNITEVGHYTFYAASERDVFSFSFELKKSEEAKKILISGVKDDDIIDLKSNPNGVTPTTTTPYNYASLTKDGNNVSGYELGQTVKDVGKYTLVVSNEKNTVTINFEIIESKSSANGNIEVTGVKQGQIVDLKANPRGVNPNCKGEYGYVSLKKDGREVGGYKLGQEIDEVGKYTLDVSNSDTSVTINFELSDSIERDPVKKVITDGDEFDLATYNGGIIAVNECLRIVHWTRIAYTGESVKDWILDDYTGYPIASPGEYRVVLVGPPGGGRPIIINFTIVDSRLN